MSCSVEKSTIKQIVPYFHQSFIDYLRSIHTIIIVQSFIEIIKFIHVSYGAKPTRKPHVMILLCDLGLNSLTLLESDLKWHCRFS